jgi:hypothetical protein
MASILSSSASPPFDQGQGGASSSGLVFHTIRGEYFRGGPAAIPSLLL